MKDDSKKAPIHTRSVVTTREVREIVARMREGLPLRCDVTISRLPVSSKNMAFAHREGRRAKISYAVNLTRQEFVDAIIHEWAHLHSGDFTHGNKWGKSYAAAYRAYHDLNYT